MSEEFHDKTVLVTGAANGIGRAIALRFAGAGAHVVAVDRDRPQLDELAGELGDRVSVVQIDCTDRAAVQSGIAEIERQHRAIDVLVNNIGQSPRERAALFHDSNPEVWDFVLSVCFVTMMNVTRHVVDGMRERRACSASPVLWRPNSPRWAGRSRPIHSRSFSRRSTRRRSAS